MGKQLLSVPSFTAGELSPRMEGRTDFAKYFNGMTKCENFVVMPHGPVTRRPGTYHVAEIKTSANKTRLIPFQFSTTQTYILEFGNQYIRFFKDNGQITESNKTITGITQANPAVVTSSSHGYSNGDFVIISGVVGMTEVNGKTFKVADKTTNTFELQDVDGNDINSSGYTAYSSSGIANKIYQITTSYTTAQIFDLKFAQSADVMYITHNSHEVSKLTRTGHTSWTLSEVEFTDGPYLDANTTSTTMTPGATSGDDQTLTASASTFASTDVGRLINFSNGYAKIRSYTSATVVKIDIKDAFDNTSAVTTWKLGAFSDTTGHPACVSFFEQRLVFADTSDQPQTLFFSKSGDYENMTSGTSSDDAMVYTIASNQVNAIESLKATRTLIVMTTGGEYSVTSGSSQDAITPTNINIRKQSNYGSAGVDALSIGNATIFLQRAKRKIRELAYNFDTDGYQAPDMTILSEHITDSGITQMDYQQEPYSVVWCVRTDGVLAGLTYNRLENVTAWHRHIFGGKSDTTKNIIQQQISFTSNSSNVNTTNNTITISSHGLSTGDPVYYYAASNAIGGLNNSNLYYTIASDSNTIKLATTSTNATAGTAISLTSAPGSDTTQYIYQGVNIQTDMIYSVAHGLKTGEIVYYDNTGTSITGLSENTKYYVGKVDDNQFQLYAKSDLLTPVNLTAAHTSEQTDNILKHAEVESVAVINGDADEDQVWVIVKRWINGAVRRYVEYFTPFDFSEDLTAFHFVDSGLAYSGDNTTSLTGLDHLEGEQVAVVGDGAAQNNKTISSGAITIDTASEEAKVGLLYSSDLQTMRLDEGYTETTQTKTKRIYDLSVRFHDTVGASVGPNVDNLTSIDFRDSSASMNLPVPLFTGDKFIEFDSDYGTEGLVYVQQPQALPMTVLGIYPRLDTENV
tara:strand:- start:805 stop:3546 length:2742 start_codon:yes stop_codon:yes gene_type:complete